MSSEVPVLQATGMAALLDTGTRKGKPRVRPMRPHLGRESGWREVLTAGVPDVLIGQKSRGRENGVSKSGRV